VKAFFVWLFVYLLGGSLLLMAAINPIPWMGISAVIAARYYIHLKGGMPSWYNDWWTRQGDRLGDTGALVILLPPSVMNVVAAVGLFFMDDNALFLPLVIVSVTATLIALRIVLAPVDVE
jgi:hypothetical protein